MQLQPPAAVLTWPCDVSVLWSEPSISECGLFFSDTSSYSSVQTSERFRSWADFVLIFHPGLVQNLLLGGNGSEDAF